MNKSITYDGRQFLPDGTRFYEAETVEGTVQLRPTYQFGLADATLTDTESSIMLTEPQLLALTHVVQKLYEVAQFTPSALPALSREFLDLADDEVSVQKTIEAGPQFENVRTIRGMLSH